MVQPGIGERDGVAVHLLGFVTATDGVCFSNGTVVEKKSLLRGDTIRYSLAGYSSGPDLTYGISNDSAKMGQLRTTFPKSGTQMDKELAKDSCQKVIQGRSSNEFIALCDSRVIHLFALNFRAKNVDRIETLQLKDKDLDCFELIMNFDKDKLFLLCRKPVESGYQILVTGISLLSKEEFKIEGEFPMEALKTTPYSITSIGISETNFIMVFSTLPARVIIFTEMEDEIKLRGVFEAKLKSLPIDPKNPMLLAFFEETVGDKKTPHIIAIVENNTNSEVITYRFSIDDLFGQPSLTKIFSNRFIFIKDYKYPALNIAKFVNGRIYFCNYAALYSCEFDMADLSCPKEKVGMMPLPDFKFKIMKDLFIGTNSYFFYGLNQASKTVTMLSWGNSMNTDERDMGNAAVVIVRSVYDNHLFNQVFVSKGGVYLLPIEEDLLQVNTSSVPQTGDYTISVDCFYNGKLVNSQPFTFDVTTYSMGKPDVLFGDSREKAPEYLMWTDSISSFDKLQGFKVLGNAPEFPVDAQEKATVQFSEYLGISQIEDMHSERLSSISYIGDNHYIFQEAGKAYAVLCSSSPTIDDSGCTLADYPPLSLENSLLLSAFSFNSYLVFALKTGEKLKITTLTKHKERSFEVDVDPSLCLIKLNGEYVEIFGVGRMERTDLYYSIFTAYFIPSKPSEEDKDSLKRITFLSEHIAPVQIAFSVDQSMLYLASSSRPSADTPYKSEVYIIYLGSETKLPEIVKHIVVKPSSSFRLCPNFYSFFLIDIENTQISLIEFSPDVVSIYDQPYTDLGFGKIKTFSCDDKGQYLQVMSLWQDSVLQVATYRMDSFSSGRVHSAIQVPAELANSPFLFLDLRTYLSRSEFYLRIFESNPIKVYSYKFQSNPSLRISSHGQEESTTLDFTVKACFRDASKHVEHKEASASVRLIAANTSFGLQKYKNREEVQLEQNVTLDTQFYTDHPWRSLRVESKKEAGFTLKNRMESINNRYEGNQNLTRVQYFENYLVGFTKVNGKSKVVILYGNQTVKEVECTPLLGDELSDYQPFTSRDSDGGISNKSSIYFFVGCRNPAQFHRIRVSQSEVVSVDTMIGDYSVNEEYYLLSRPGYKANFITIIMAEPKGTMKVLSMSGNSIIDSQPVTVVGMVKDAISLENRLVAISAEGSKIGFYCITFTSMNSRVSLYKDETVNILEKIGAGHYGRLLKCELVDKQDKQLYKIRCLFDSLDIRYVYSVLIDLNLQSPDLNPDKKIGMVVVKTTLENVLKITYNTKIESVRMKDGFVAIVSKNLNPEYSSKRKIGGSNLVVVYNLNLRTEEYITVGEAQVLITNPYKLFTCQELNFDCSNPDLQLEAELFNHSRGLRLAVNSAQAGKHIQLFSTNPAQITIKPGMILNSHAVLTIEGYGEESIVSEIGDVLDTAAKSLAYSNQKLRVLVIAFGCCIILTILIVLLACCSFKSVDSDLEERLKVKVATTNDQNPDSVSLKD